MKRRLISVLLLFLLLCSACQTRQPKTASSADTVFADYTAQDTISDSTKESEPELITFTDALGREITTARPQRVAASIGSFADIWCLAGGADTLVATASDAWTSFQLNLSDSVINIGSVKDPSLETLLSAEPDLVIASTNTSANLEWQEPLEAAGIPIAYFDVEHFEDYLQMLEICTQLTGCTENYARYGTDIRDQVTAAISRQTGAAPTVLYVRASGSSCKVKGSSGNVLGEMLADLGCVNIADSDASLLENLSLEAIIAADPDFIFAVLQGADPTDAEQLLNDTLLANPAWAQLSAVQANRFYMMDASLYNLKPNARWGEAYENLADILYPEKTK